MALAEAIRTQEISQEGFMNIKIIAGNTTLSAQLENNAASRALTKKFPLTVFMRDLYQREMCYRMGSGSLPSDSLRNDGYNVGDIAYWPPMGSLVILYEQNGEKFQRQHLGHIDKGVEIFKGIGDCTVTFDFAN